MKTGAATRAGNRRRPNVHDDAQVALMPTLVSYKLQRSVKQLNWDKPTHHRYRKGLCPLHNQHSRRPAISSGCSFHFGLKCSTFPCKADSDAANFWIVHSATAFLDIAAAGEGSISQSRCSWPLSCSDITATTCSEGQKQHSIDHNLSAAVVFSEFFDVSWDSTHWTGYTIWRWSTLKGTDAHLMNGWSAHGFDPGEIHQQQIRHTRWIR